MADARTRLVCLAALVVLAAGCSGTRLGGPISEPILGAVVLPDQPNAVEVEFSGCDSEPAVDVVESDSSVRITIDGPNGGCEPVYELTVELDEPLGDRTIIDGATGDEVPITNR